MMRLREKGLADKLQRALELLTALRQGNFKDADWREVEAMQDWLDFLMAKMKKENPQCCICGSAIRQRESDRKRGRVAAIQSVPPPK